MVEPDPDVESELARLLAERFERDPVPPSPVHGKDAVRAHRRALLAHDWPDYTKRPDTYNPPEGV